MLSTTTTERVPPKQTLGLNLALHKSEIRDDWEHSQGHRDNEKICHSEQCSYSLNKQTQLAKSKMYTNTTSCLSL